MNQKLKQHINNINKGIIPKGYKKTKLGIIPEEWDLRKIKDIAPLQRGFDLPSYQLKEGIHPVGYSNGVLNYHEEYKVKGPGVYTGRSGTIGKVFFIEEDYWPHNTTLWVTNFFNNNPKFIYYFYHSVNLKKFNAGTSVPTLNRNDVHIATFPLPPLPEQQKIANILTTWDKAIELKEQLIEQKQAQKKGFMQNLLTGKVRLKGFTEEWKEVKLGEIGTFKTSSVDKKIVDGEEKVRLLNYMDVYKNKIIDERIDFMEVTANQKQIESSNMRYGDVAFTPSSETPDDIGHSSVFQIKDSNVLHSYHVVRLRFNMDMDIDFKGYIFNVEYLLNEFSRRATGSTRFTLSISDFKEVSIKLPFKIKEQKAIANILKTSDKELELLNQELESLKEQKKGLMQLLLTGKVRVKV